MTEPKIDSYGNIFITQLTSKSCPSCGSMDSCGNSYVSQSDRLCDCIEYCIGTKKTKWAIPDLQRDFVWNPSQILLLLDSLFKGWPFGTLTVLRIDRNRPLCIAFRPFIRQKHNFNAEKHTYFSLPVSFEEMDADNALFLVLDGQQRLQSLSMALGDDTASFISDDNGWMWEMGVWHRKIRNHEYKLCPPAYVYLDPEALALSYAKNDGILSQIDYCNDKVLVWGISKPDFHSLYYDRNLLQQALPRMKDANGVTRLIRLSKIWRFAGECADINEVNMTQQIVNWNIPVEKTSEINPSLIAFSKRLAELRNTPVCRLELLPPDKSVSDDQYSNTIVNIFTRLNKGGKELTSEEITFAWLKRGWDETATQANAKTCFYGLQKRCENSHQSFTINELIIMSSYVWAIAGGGKIIKDNDLLNSQLLQELTKWLSLSWQSFANTTASVAEELNKHDIHFHGQFNTISVFAIWVASQLIISEGKKIVSPSPRDCAEYSDKVSVTDTMLVRFFLCSQWSGYWNDRLLSFVNKMNSEDVQQLSAVEKAYALVNMLSDAMKAMSAIACRRIDDVSADNRSQVVRYQPFLWVWHRLNKERFDVWKSFIDGWTHVDHALAFAYWLRLIGKEASTMTKTEYDEAERVINSLGNCILLKSDYNCSKSDKPFSEYFSWFPPDNEAKLLLLQPCMTAPKPFIDNGGTLDEIKTAMEVRAKAIRNDLKAFANGDPGFTLQN